MEQGAPRGRPPFPGMDPWLERPELWPDFHNGLIEAIRGALSPRVLPRYLVRVESRIALLTGYDIDLIDRPDVALWNAGLTAPRHPSNADVALLERAEVEPIEVAVPVDDIEETYLTVKEVSTRKLVTVIEVLSPTNKCGHDARREYVEKRRSLIRSRTNYIEIDLLREGRPMPLEPPPPPNDYRILVCRGWTRSKALVYVFPWTVPVPSIPVPLLLEDDEPVLDLNGMLHRLMELARYDLEIDYHRLPKPPLREADAAWAAAIIAGTREDGPRSRTGTGPGPSDPAVSREAQP